MPFKSIAVVSAVAAVALGVAACGGSDDSSSTTASKHLVQPAQRFTELSGQSTAVALNPDFMTSMDTFKIKTTALGGSAISADQVVTFPISSGTLDYYTPGTTKHSFVEGQIHTSGSGLTMTKGSKVVTLSNFIIEPGRSRVAGTVTVNGKVISLKLPIFALNQYRLHPLTHDPTAGTATFPTTPWTLTAPLAHLLNKTFGTTGFVEGWRIGNATITLDDPTPAAAA